MQFPVRLSQIGFLVLACLAPVAVASPSAAQGGVPPKRDPVGTQAPKREPRTGEELVQVSVGVVGEAKPGATVRVAATFTIHPGWHIYWLNPGDSGMATQITLDLPEGCSAAKTRDGELAVDFPIPQVFRKGETTIGYERSVTLSVPVTLPKELPQSGLPVRIATRWLVCKEACLLGRNEATIDLAKPVAADAPVAKALADSLARVPTPAPPEWKFALSEVAESTAVLTISAPGADALQFIPFETPGVNLAAVVADANGGSLRAELSLSRESSLGKPMQVAGIVVVGNKARAHSFHLPLPEAGSK